MSATPHCAPSACETCGTALRATAAEGLCGVCLLQFLTTDAPASDPPAAGEVIRFFGDYELLEEVARGGMGVVYRARQVSLNRIVAVKLLAGAGDGSKGFAERFKVEAEAAAALDHPNIVPVYEFGAYAGQPFLAMRYVTDGRSLSGARLSPRAAAEIMVKTAQAMHYAHQRGVLHRDLKPANILLDENDEPLVGDFGLAKLMETDTGLTHSVEMMGTPAYMPPEQASGKLSLVTTAADVYGLGAVFYELLTGHAPFTGESSLEIIRKVTDEPPARLSSPGHPVDRDFETICLKCLEKEPAKRYASALALAEDLQRWLSDEPIRARPSGRMERLWKWARRHPAIAAVSAISLVAVTVIAIGSTLFSLRLRRSAELNRQQIIALHQLTAQQMVDEGEGFTGLLHLVEAIKLEEQEAQGSARVLRRVFQSIVETGPSPTQIWFHGKKVKDAVFSPDGRKVLAGCDDGTAFLYDVASGNLLHTLKHGWRIERVYWNATGTRIALWSDKAFATLWDPASGQQIGLPLWAWPTISFHPDGSRLLVSTPLQVQERDAEDGRLLRVLHPQEVKDAAWFPDGSRVVLSLAQQNGKHVLLLLDAVSGTVQGTSCAESSPLLKIAVSRDGSTIAACALKSSIYLWRTADFAEPPLRWQSDQEELNSLAFDRTGKQVITAGNGGRVDFLSAAAGVGDHQLNLGRPAASAGFSGDGRWLATTTFAGSVEVRETASRALAAPGLWHGQAISCARFSPDSQSLLTASFDGTVRVFRLPADGGAATVLKDPAGIRHFSPAARHGEWLTNSGNGRLCRWDVQGGTPQAERSIEGFSNVLGLDAASDTAIMLRGREIEISGLTSGETRHRISLSGHLEKITRWAFAPVTGLLVVSGHPPVSSLSPINALLRDKTTTAARLLNSSTIVESAVVFHVKTGQPIASAVMHPDTIRGVAFSPDGTRFVTACDDGGARIFDSATGLLLRELKHDFPLTSACFSPDGLTVLTACGGWKHLPRPVKSWSASDGLLRWTAWEEDDVIAAIFSPDGSRIATSSQDGMVRLLHAGNGSVIGVPLPLSRRPDEIRFSPDSRLLAIAGNGREPGLLDAFSGAGMSVSLPHPKPVKSTVFSADSRVLATLADDGIVRLWPLDRATGDISRLQRIAEVLSNHTLEANRLRRLTAEELRRHRESP